MTEYLVVRSEGTSLGAVLRRMRASAGLTQEELADRSGLSARAVSDIERGVRRSIYKDTAARLADALSLEGVERAGFETLARGRELEASSASSRDPFRRNLPPRPSRLIGRDIELDIILGSFSDPSVRLLTITGSGGIGKTRLAAEVVARADALFADGVFFVSLAGLEQADLVLPAIAQEIRLTPLMAPTAEAIAAHLATKKVLLVLDTFEHVLEAARGVGELLDRSDELKVLVTTREALRVRYEHVVPLAPLPASSPEKTSGVELSPAVTLFVERARMVSSDFSLDESTREAVVGICEHVSGLPLAIELAAARLRHLPAPALRDRLGVQLDLLAAGPHDLPRRHRAMRDTIAWSNDLLDEEERSLFRSLSAFAGGFTLEAIGSVWPPKSIDGAFATISALVDKSLVTISPDTEGEPRYVMLDVIAEYAYELAVAAEEVADLAGRHCRYFVELAERAEPEFGRRDGDLWLRRLTAEHANLRRALTWALSADHGSLACRLGGALWQFWRAAGYYSEGRSWLARALKMEGGDDAARAKAMWGAAWLALHQGDLDDAQSRADQMLNLATRLDYQLVLRNATTVQGLIGLARGDTPGALPLLERSVEICRGTGPPWLLATSLLNLGLALVHARPQEAGEPLGEARSLYEDLGDERFAARSDTYAGHAELAQDHHQEARSKFLTSFATFRRLGDAAGTAEAVEGLAAACAASGSLTEAALLLGASDAIRADLMAVPHPFEQVLLDRRLDVARASLGDEEWDRSRERGRSMDVDDAIRSL
ncbi:MAG: helix-turn-helix domain-containing protein [Actinomycetota bacterium]